MKSRVTQQLEDRLEQQQVEEATRSIPDELLPFSEVNQRLRETYHKACSAFQSDVRDIVESGKGYDIMPQALVDLANQCCPELHIMRQKLDVLMQWNEYAFISDWMLEHYPKSKRARNRRKELEEQGEKKPPRAMK